MSKYIDADKLKAVLANHYQEITVPVITEQGGIESYFRRAEIHDILNIITPLQQEQPEVDLEKEANECWDYVFSAIGWDENSLITMNHKEFLAFARHFYELGPNARKNE